MVKLVGYQGISKRVQLYNLGSNYLGSNTKNLWAKIYQHHFVNLMPINIPWPNIRSYTIFNGTQVASLVFCLRYKICQLSITFDSCSEVFLHFFAKNICVVSLKYWANSRLRVKKDKIGKSFRPWVTAGECTVGHFGTFLAKFSRPISG